MADYTIHTTKLDDGTFIVVSAAKPRFCISGETLDKALDRARAAVAYYEHRHGTVELPTPRQTTLARPAYRAQVLDHEAA